MYLDFFFFGLCSNSCLGRLGCSRMECFHRTPCLAFKYGKSVAKRLCINLKKLPGLANEM
jgi:hypothetical protein